MAVLKKAFAYSKANTVRRFFVISGNTSTEVTAESAAQNTMCVAAESDIDAIFPSFIMVFNVIPDEWRDDAAQRHAARMHDRMTATIEYVDLDLPLNIDGANW